jgi:GAF domain-containing protein
VPDLVTMHENLAKVVLVGRDLTEVLTDITHVALPQIPGAEAASITLVRGTRADTAAYVGQMALAADELQYARGHGPCLEAGEGGQILIVDDMHTEQRWPDYTAAAVEHGIGSSLSVPLPFQSVTVGALNTYATEPRALGREALPAAEDVASWIAHAVGNAEAAARTAEDLAGLRTAMKSRAVIEQAKGVLIERYRLTEDQAFAVLIRSSQTNNVKVRDIADHLVSTGELLGQAQHARR